MRVFFSSELDPQHPLALATKKLDLDLIQQSLITFEGVSALPSRSYDIVFFGSPRAYHFAKHLLSKNIEIACFSKGTAHHINQPIHWQGTTPGNPTQTGLDFTSWVGERRVLFPISDRSLRSITKLFPPQQIEELVVYKTLLNPMPIPPCDVYIFTSPSNVDSFFQANALPVNAKLVAWGESTKSALVHRELTPDLTQNSEGHTAWEEVLSAWANP
ncbi:MAG: hypothetical protein EBS09_10040 [Flavobacteriia bacterium]|nr:hypothetical protein [Flavobacteriia bacterium]